MKRVDDNAELTDAEAESVAQAVDIYRRQPTAPSFFQTVPMRDDAGRLCEVRFFLDGDSQRPLAVIRIADDGALAPIQDLR
jgi:hypothetical protein